MEYTEYYGDRRVSGGGNTKSLTQLLLASMIPQGYPNTVSKDYAAFQFYDSLQALCSYIRGLLTSQALLKGIGVGQESATPLSAALNFFWRDFIAMLSGVVFASCQGQKFDSHAKQWRLFADVLNNVGYTLELASPLFGPSAFLVLACLGSIARAVTGVAGGATRSSLTQHFALADNLGDCAAKEQSQETATTLVGMTLGMLVLRLVGDRLTVIWSIFAALSFLHVWANMRALRSLQLDTLNRPRTEILFAQFVAQTRAGVPAPQVSGPAEMAWREGLAAPPIARLLARLSGHPQPDITLGARLSDLGERDILDAAGAKFAARSPRQGSVLMLIRRDAGPEDVLQAFCFGLLLANLQLLQSRQEVERSREAREWMSRYWGPFVAALRNKGWSLRHLLLGETGWRADWGRHKHAE